MIVIGIKEMTVGTAVGIVLLLNVLNFIRKHYRNNNR